MVRALHPGFPRCVRLSLAKGLVIGLAGSSLGYVLTLASSHPPLCDRVESEILCERASSARAAVVKVSRSAFIRP